MAKKSVAITKTAKATPKATAPKATGNTNVVALVKAISDSIKPTDTNITPNAQFPFGIKITDAKGNISWERYKTAADRDKRNESVKGKRVDFAAADVIPSGPSKITSSPDPKPAIAAKIGKGGRPMIVTAKPAKAEPAKPASKPAIAAKPKGDTIAMHLNKTGRLCLLRDAAERISDFFPDGHMAISIEKGLVRLTPSNKASEGSVNIGNASGRPYVSMMKAVKALGFDGSESRDIEAKPYGSAGFEFRLS
jgi:hypothetical protein